jgi:hypothetical protein
MARQPLGGLVLVIFRRFTITLLDTPHLVGLLWTSDQPVAETSTWQHTTLTRDNFSQLEGNTTGTEYPLKVISKVGMFSVWYFMLRTELSIYQKLLSFIIQVRGHKFNNKEIY